MTRGTRIVDKDTRFSFGRALGTRLFQVTFDLGFCASLKKSLDQDILIIAIESKGTNLT